MQQTKNSNKIAKQILPTTTPIIVAELLSLLLEPRGLLVADAEVLAGVKLVCTFVGTVAQLVDDAN